MVPSFSKDYSVGAVVGSSFSVAVGYGIVVLRPRTTHLTPQKLHYWIHGGNFVLLLSRDCSYIIHFKIFKSYSSLSLIREDLFSTSGVGRGDVCPSTTHMALHSVSILSM